MSSRADQKAEARAAREAAEQQAAQSAVRRKRLITFGGVLAAAAAIIVAVVLITGGDDGGGEGPPEQLAMFDGIAQEGAWLGDPNAPVVMEEYADLQCPHCKDFALENLPPIVEDFVKSGEVRIRLRMVSILGPDSETAARFFGAAKLQNRGWQFAEAFFAEQGVEASYVDEDFLRARAEEAGVDADQAFADQTSAKVTSEMQADQRAFDEAGIDGTPGVRIGQKDGELRTVDVGDVPAELQKEVEKGQSAAD